MMEFLARSAFQPFAPVLVYLFTSFFFIFVFNHARRQGHKTFAKILLLLFVFTGVFWAFVTIVLHRWFDFGGNFAYMVLLSLPTATFTLLLHWTSANYQAFVQNRLLNYAIVFILIIIAYLSAFQINQHFQLDMSWIATPLALYALSPLRQKARKIPEGLIKLRNELALTILIFCLAFSPLSLFYPIQNTCNWLARMNATPIIYALEDYRTQTGNYPESLEQLVPAYLGSIPLQACRGADPHDFGFGQNYFLDFCTNPNGKAIHLGIRGNDSSVQIYDFQTGEWSLNDNFHPCYIQGL